MLFSMADPAARQAAFVLAALNGSAGGVRRMIELGIPVDAPSETLYSHGTPLHHAVAAASLETVLVLTAAGADIHRRDAGWGATPLGWAEHMIGGEQGERRATMEAIANHLRSMGEAGP